MGNRKEKGFTLIEVILFLAITGMIIAGLLIGVGASLNRQRYSDATTGAVSYFQNQYSQVSNVSNNRPNNLVCRGGAIVDAPGDTSSPVGTSDCTIVGRLIQSRPGGVGVMSYPVYATVDAGTLPRNASDNDLQILRDARLIAATEGEEYTPSWGTRFLRESEKDETGRAAPNQAPEDANFAILIVRMPTSGIIHTYVSDTSTASPAEIVQETDPSDDFFVCVSPEGLLGMSTSPAGVLIQNNATGSSGVIFTSQGDC